MGKLRILLVDDDPDFTRRFVLLSNGLFDVKVASSAIEALNATRVAEPEAVVLDVDLGQGTGGIEVLRRLRGADPDLPVIMVSGDERPETIVAAMKAGATDYISKRPNLELLRIKLERALDNLRWRAHARHMQIHGGERLVGSSPAMQRLEAEIQRLAPTRMSVMIRGESGTGKELVAAAIHEASPRRGEKVVTLAGAEGTDELFDSTLFGHERGAFTGADRRRLGKLELAHRGTLFIDEVAKLARSKQGKMLRVVETGRFERLGGTEEIAVDVRLLTASNEDIEARIASGDFLEDLYWRLCDYQIVVPPLRDRLSDLPDLCRALLDRFAQKEAIESPQWEGGALDPLAEHRWPGNVRELDKVLKRAMILAAGTRLTADLMRAALDGHRTPVPARVHVHVDPSQTSPGSAATASVSRDAALGAFCGVDYRSDRLRLEQAFDRLYFDRELRRHGGVVSRAAERLGMSRQTLHKKLTELGLDRPGPEDDRLDP